MQQSVIGWAAIYVAIAVALFGLAVVLVALRRRVLQRDGGFDLCLRLHPGRWGGGWVFGVGRYDGDQIAWYRTFGVSLRPQLCLVRRELTVVNRRRPVDGDEWHVPPGHVVLACRNGDDDLDLSMEPPAVTGFLAWLESAPPGQQFVA